MNQPLPEFSKVIKVMKMTRKKIMNLILTPDNSAGSL